MEKVKVKISEIRGNLKTWQEQRNALLERLERLDRRTQEIEKKLDKLKQEEEE